MRGVIRKRVGKRGITWQVGIYLGRDPATGQKKRRWYTYRTKPEAERQVAQLVMQVQGGLGAPPTRLLVGDYLEQWLRDDVSARLQPTTVQIYTNAVRSYLIPALPAVPLPRLSAPAIQRLLNEMLARGLSPATAHQAYRVLRTALATAVRWGLLVRNPCDAARPPRVDPRPATIWDEEQTRLFLAAARRLSRHYTLYLTLLCTGMRPGEALALRWPNVDLLAGRVIVREKVYRLGTRLVWGATKTHQQLVGSIPEPLVDTLRRHGEDQRTQRAMAGDRYEDAGLVFCQPDGKPLHERNIARRDFQRIAKAAGLPRIRLYDLRHCCGTHMADQGTPIHVVQRRLGHRNAATTMQYYLHAVPATERHASDRLAARLLGTGDAERDSQG